MRFMTKKKVHDQVIKNSRKETKAEKPVTISYPIQRCEEYTYRYT